MEGDITREDKGKLQVDFTPFFQGFKNIFNTEIGTATTSLAKKALLGPLAEFEGMFKPILGTMAGMLTISPFKRVFTPKKPEVSPQPVIQKDDVKEGVEEGFKAGEKSSILKVIPEKNWFQDFKDWYGGFWDDHLYTLKESLEKGEEEKKKGLLAGLLGGLSLGALAKGLMGGLKGFFGGIFRGLGKIMPKMLKGLGKGLLKAAPFLALAGGIIWGVVDAIKGVMKAKQWGTSKVSAGIAGFLAGTKSGWRGAFSNMGKWALIGSGIGMMIGGPIGALAGGMAGAAIGGLLGFIGGQRIAKAFDEIGQFVAKGVTTFVSWIVEGVSKIWDWIKSGFTKIFDTISNIFSMDKVKNVIKAIADYNPFALIVQGIGAIINKIFGTDIDFKPSALIKNYIVPGISSIFSKIGEFFSKFDIGNLIKDAGESLLEGITNFINWIKENLNPVNWVKEGLGKLKGLFGFGKEEETPVTTEEQSQQERKGIKKLLPHFAEGGIVTKPTLAVVGEKGSEAIIPLADAKTITGSINNLRMAEERLASLLERQMIEQQRQAKEMSKAITNVSNVRNTTNQNINIVSPIQNLSDIPSSIYDQNLVLVAMGVI